MQMLDEAVRAPGPTDADEPEWEPVRLDVDVDAYVPADYVPYEQAKIDVHRRIAGALDVAAIETLREELEDRFGPVPAGSTCSRSSARGSSSARRARGRSPSAAGV